MSLQRVFESARKLGVPVIMTDPAGREPMVVLTLEQFEAMAGTGSEPGREPTSNPVRRGRPPSRRPAESPKVDDFAFPADELKAQPSLAEPALEDYPVPTPSEGEISLDERFYLEPLDDGKTP